MTNYRAYFCLKINNKLSELKLQKNISKITNNLRINKIKRLQRGKKIFKKNKIFTIKILRLRQYVSSRYKRALTIF